MNIKRKRFWGVFVLDSFSVKGPMTLRVFLWCNLFYNSIFSFFDCMDFTNTITKRGTTQAMPDSKLLKLGESQSASKLCSLGVDTMIKVLSYVDGESMYELSCANHPYTWVAGLTSRFESIVSLPDNWEHCVLDLRSMTSQRVFATIRKYGELIRTLKIIGPLSILSPRRLYDVIAQYCPNMEFVDVLGIIGFFPLSKKTTAISFPFPSCSSDYLTIRDPRDRFCIYSMNDSVCQNMSTCSQDLSRFGGMIWQFEIENHIREGFSLTFQCIINSFVVGSFSVADATTGRLYAINMYYPLPKIAGFLNTGILSLTIRCASSLPFGCGYVRISSCGRVSFVVDSKDFAKIDPIVPSFFLE